VNGGRRGRSKSVSANASSREVEKEKKMVVRLNRIVTESDLTYHWRPLVVHSISPEKRDVSGIVVLWDSPSNVLGTS